MWGVDEIRGVVTTSSRTQCNIQIEKTFRLRIQEPRRHGRQQAGTGLEDNIATHNDYGEDFIRSTRRVGKSLPIQEEATLPTYSVELGVQDLQVRMSSRRTEIRRS